MKIIRKTLKPMSFCLVVIMFLIVAPIHSVSAAMVGTEMVMDSTRSSESRAYLRQMLAREDMRDALIAQGIAPHEARARIDSLTDQEVIRIADQIDQLPAGSGAIEVLLVIILAGFIVLVITDLTGVTDVFPFIKSQR